MSHFENVVFFSGGVGGARLLQGMAQVLPPAALTAIVNTGDDLVHWGLNVSPDLDTVLYTLAGIADDARGWGLRDETFHALAAMQQLGEESWFSLGDRDLATHMTRTQALARGETLTQVTARLCRSLGVAQRVLPMCDQPRPTEIATHQKGLLAFQEWLVKERAPRVQSVHFEGEPDASAEVLAALSAADLIVIGPSNPFVSVDPILSLRGVRERIAGKRVLAVSPIVQGRAVKGPLADMIGSLLGRAPSAAAVAGHYGSLLSGFVVEHGDEADLGELPVLATSTVMKSSAERAELARQVLAFAQQLD